MAARAARPARARLRRVRHRLPDGACHGARRSSASRARRGRLEPRPRRTGGLAAAPDDRGGGAARHGRPRAALPGDRLGAARRRPGRRAGAPPGRAPARPSRAGADDRLHAGRQRQQRRVRPAGGDRRCSHCGGRLAARGRRLRPVGSRNARPPPPRRRCGARRLVGARRAQAAQRPVRLGDRLLRAPRVAPRGHGGPSQLSRAGRSCGRARPDGLDAGVLASRARIRGLRGPPFARPVGRGGAGRALLQPCAHVRRAPRRGR